MPKAEKNKVAPNADADDRTHVSDSSFDDRSRALKDADEDNRAAATQPAHMFQQQTDDDFVEELEGMGLTCNHARVLLLIGTYARAARHAEEKEGWIRQVALIIMMYEGIVQGLLDFDYAPNSTLVSQDNHRCQVLDMPVQYVASQTPVAAAACGSMSRKKGNLLWTT